jgi:hypothetical protein
MPFYQQLAMRHILLKVIYDFFRSFGSRKVNRERYYIQIKAGMMA